MPRATATIRGTAAIPHLAPELRLFVLEVLDPAFPRADGVSGYAVGEGPRDRATQDAYYAGPESDAPWGESAHNFDPSWGVGLYPIRDGVVSNERSDYDPIVELVDSMGGLFKSGADWGWDAGHVEVFGWRAVEPEYTPMLEVGDGSPDRAGVAVGGLVLLALVGVAAARALS